VATRVADVLVVVSAALLWAAFVVKAIDARRHPDKPTLRMLAAMLGSLAVTATLFSPQVNTWLSGLTGIPNIAEPVARTFLVLGAWLVQAFLLHLTQPSAAEAARRSRKRLWPAIATVGLLWVLFVAAPVDQTTERMTAEYGDLPVVQAYLLVFLLYLGVAVVDLMRGALRYAPAATGPLRVGLRCVGLGAAFGLAYVSVKVVFLLLVMAGSPGPPELESILARSAAAAAGILVVVGATWPAIGPRVAAARSGVAAYIRHRRLYPLWAALYRVEPGIALDPVDSAPADALRVGQPGFRLYRRVIEIQDGRLALRPYLDAEVADRLRDEAGRCGLRGRDADAFIEARVLRAGIDAASRGQLARQATASITPGGDDLEAEVEWLMAVAQQFRRAGTGVSLGRPPAHAEAS
jgi:hypothetical protein